MPTGNPKEMVNVKVNRVALLLRSDGQFPANRRPVVLIKGADMADESEAKTLNLEVDDADLWGKVLKGAMAKDGLGEHENAVTAVLAKAEVSKEDATAIKAALKMLRSVKSVPAGVLKQLSALINAGFPFAEKPKEGGADDDKKPAFLKSSAYAPLLKSDGTVDDEKIDAIEDAKEQAIIKTVSDLAAENRAMAKKDEARDKLLKAEVNKRRLTERVTKAAKDMGDVPGATPDVLGSLLLKAEDNTFDADDVSQLEGILKAASKNSVNYDTKRHGTSARGGGGATVEGFTKAAVKWAKDMGKDAGEHAAMESFLETETGQRMAEEMDQN